MLKNLKYGNGYIELSAGIPSPAKIITTSSFISPIKSDDIIPSFRKSLLQPASGPPLGETIIPGAPLCIVVSDRTRRYGAEIWLSALVEECIGLGVPDDLVTVLLATGTHGPHSDTEKENVVGPEVFSRVRVADHDCDDVAGMTELGTTPAGTPVSINSIAADAPNLVTTGIVMPHYYAGFTGGRKSILPGIASRRTIFANHSLNLAPGGGTHPGARTMVLDGNPVHEDMSSVLDMVEVSFSISVVTAEDGTPAAFFTGGLPGAHIEACRAARGWMGFNAAEPFDWIIASAGGHPKDLNFYQSHKALDNAFRAVRPGGTIILAAMCSEGIGPEGFLDWFEIGDRNEIESRLRAEYIVMGHTALRTLEKTSGCRVLLLSELPADHVEKMGMTPVSSIDEAALHLDSASRGAIIPDAASVVPVITGLE